MAHDERKIANAFTLPKRPFLRGIAGIASFRGSRVRFYTRQILERSEADAMRADWEAVSENLRWAIGEYEKKRIKDTVIMRKGRLH